ncbi:hypothetical protein [Paraflavitalea pollutisoli]|uniref:hypothetical protein n=1 Tax=Paraflavitalea pollutisoli TaxID=3034143 RepID=UPI0023ED8F40|nr:hypothetical protein [Paraflavitalea sp. H1-2-19X]
MNYSFLNPVKETLLSIDDKLDRNTVLDNIITLRATLNDKNKGIPEKRIAGNLLLGTWSIRAMGAGMFEGRMTEALYYIAEIVARYDLIILQDLKDNHTELSNLCRILGDDWGLFTGLIIDPASGNREWLAFLYDKRTVTFRNIAIQLVMPQPEHRSGITASPYFLRFQSACFLFDVCSMKLFTGLAAKNTELYQRRTEELAGMTNLLKTEFVEKNECNNLFIFGDFNVPNRHSDRYKAITGETYRMPESLLKDNLPGHIGQDRSCAQVIHYNRFNDVTFRKAGTFNYFDVVFDNYKTYAKRARKHSAKVTSQKTFDEFKTYQMSDHLPIWIEMNTDHAENYLQLLKTKD